MEELSPQGRNLFHLALSLVEIGPAIEIYKQPAVIGGYDPSRLVCLHEDADCDYFAR